MLAVLTAVGFTVYGQRQSPTKQTWEYKTIYSNSTGFEGDKTFNELGAQGWEMIATSGDVAYIFKRSR